MISNLIGELVNYGLENGLIEPEDKIYCTNQLLDLLQVEEYDMPEEIKEHRPVAEILNDLTNYAIDKKILENDTITYRDLFDTKVMGLITPPPSTVRKNFDREYKISPSKATDYFYNFSMATNYIRNDRIEKNQRWRTETKFGDIEITINLSKPEKDPRDIAKQGAMKNNSSYPSCLLCKENEGFAGSFNHPARQNHRIIPITLSNEQYYLQYSPYVYYNEHCIVLHEKHIPMKIDRAVFSKLLDFINQFPHYTIGSNADLPIVGGSILSHDHFQGGNYDFPMASAPYELTFKLKDYPSLKAGIVKWPLSVIRLQGERVEEIVDASDSILKAWRNYTDEAALIYSHTDGTPHNTITPIARKRGSMYEMDLVLRNNLTTDQYPYGLYHPHEEYHHIKKENIGLIEVMGLAILPPRLKSDMAEIRDAMLNGRDLSSSESLKSHCSWVLSWKDNHSITRDNIDSIIQDEIGKAFAEILECAGVYKCTKEGRDNFMRFIKSL